MDKQELHERVAENIKKIRRKKRIVLREFDGVTCQCVWKAENPKTTSNISLYAVYKIAENLGCTIDELINGNPEDIIKNSQA